VVGGEEIELSSLRGHKPVVIFFFPRPGAPADSQIALDFLSAHPEIHKGGVALLGICNDPPPKLVRFAGDLGITYPILHDPGGRVAALYGAYALKNVQGRSYRGIIRSTFLVDRAGNVVRAWNRVHVRGHVDQVMVAVAALSKDRRRDGQD